MKRTILSVLVLLTLSGCGMNRQLVEARKDLTLMRVELTSMRQAVERMTVSTESIEKNTGRAATAVEGSRDDLRTALGLPAVTSE